MSKNCINWLILILVVILFGRTLAMAQDNKEADTLQATASQKAPDEGIEVPLSFIGVGDIMLGTNFPDSSYLPPFPPENLMKPVDSILRSADFTFGNLEGVFLDTGEVAKDCEDSTLCYAFRMPESYADALQQSGFDLISLANNHSGDFGKVGRENTVRVLRDLDIHPFGLENIPTVLLKKQNKIIGAAAFSPNFGTPDINDPEKAEAIVKQLADTADIVLVSFHGGAEGDEHQHVTRELEEYYGEKRGNVYEFSHRMIDAGADIIFGHGPHVPRAIELYQNRIIAYSLGNFATWSRFKIAGENGLAPIFKVWTTRTGEFRKGKIFAAKQTGEGGPKPDPGNAVIREIKALMNADFPKTPLSITQNGLVFPIN